MFIKKAMAKFKHAKIVRTEAVAGTRPLLPHFIGKENIIKVGQNKELNRLHFNWKSFRISFQLAVDKGMEESIHIFMIRHIL